MGRTNRNRKRKKANDLETQSSPNGRFESMDSDDMYINLARSLYRNGWLNETSLKVGEFPATGRGIYSTRSFQKHDLLISLPITSLISIATIADDMKFRGLLKRTFADAEKQITSQSLLALYLLYLKHSAQRTEYMSTLPGAFTVPYFCRADEIDGMVASVRDKVAEQRDTVDADYARCRLHFEEARCMCCGRRYFCDIFDRCEFEWAFFAVNSRSVYLSPEKIPVRHIDAVRTVQKLVKDEPTLALAPFLDLLNHSCTASTGLYIKNTDAGPLYQLYTTVPFAKYEQVFISYGALDNVKLLTEYGFFLAGNKHDFVELKRNDVDGYLKRLPYRVRALLAKENVDRNLYVNRANGFSHNIRIIIYMLCAGSAAHAANAADDNHLKRLIYGDGDHFALVTNDMKAIAGAIIAAKVNEYRDHLAAFDERQSSGTLSETANIYMDYLSEAIEWLEATELQ